MFLSIICFFAQCVRMADSTVTLTRGDRTVRVSLDDLEVKTQGTWGNRLALEGILRVKDSLETRAQGAGCL